MVDNDPVICISASAGNDFRRVIGRWGFFALAFGAVVGSGWIIVLGGWLNTAGPIGAALGFAVGGTVMVGVALCYGELAARFPRVGAEYLYVQEAFGPHIAFVVAWFLTLYAISTCAFEAIAFGWLVRTLIPAVAMPTAYSVGGDVTWDALALGCAGALGVAYVHLRGARSAIRLQTLVTFSFIGVIAAIILAGWSAGSAANLTPLFSGGGSASRVAGIAWVLATSTFFLNGWQVALHAIEERRADTSIRTTVHWIAGGVASATLFYVGIILSASSIEPWQSFAARDMPAVAAFRALGGPALAAVVVAVALASLVKTWLALAWMASRLLVALARRGRMPASLGRLDCRTGSPRVAVLVVTAITLLGLCAGHRAIEPIVGMASICLAMTLIVCLVALLRVRRRCGASVQFRVPGGRVTIALALAGASVMVAAATLEPVVHGGRRLPVEWVLLAVWGAVGALLSAIARRTTGHRLDSDEQLEERST